MKYINFDRKERFDREWNDVYEKSKYYRMIDHLLAYMTIDELKDIVEYLRIIMRKKEAKGDFDYLKKKEEIKET
jgi:hypothetical protein